ncbi:hypothetical protein A5755_14125 [Mycolicibacterium fortuitum]|nr:hypothetical protein A5755_14125 [Mycolicibacterium fortuitum]OBF85604.1 hypothetical protein A5751_09815 [Mycolicibacterium fortuitum]
MFPNQLAAERAVSDKGGRCNACFAYLKSDPGEVSAPSLGENTRCGICWGPSGQCDCTARLLGESVTHYDLAAHVAVSLRDRDDRGPFQSYSVLAGAVASSLLADFNITRRA